MTSREVISFLGSDPAMPIGLAVIDLDLIVSLADPAKETLLTLSPLAVVVTILLVPYAYRILFLEMEDFKAAGH
tara:strand:- start:2521 stop:2742 length:222 start_codon:yes stop_codon:yes gene_type:complete